MERALAEEGIAGATWATVDHDGEIHVGAAGFADVGSGRTMRADDRVQVGSIAKAVLATGVLHLASAQRMDLDAPVASVLPGVTFDNPWEATDPVRLRHLLDHTAGLDDLRLWQFFSLRAAPDTPLSATFADDARPLRVRSRPGSRFSYSNTGYALLGRVIERTTGQRYEHWLDTHLLRPLRMRDSTFRFVTQAGSGADPRLAMGHFEDGRAQPAVPLHVRPAAQFTTTAADMARFALFLMGDGTIDGMPFVAPELMRARGKSAGTEAAAAGLAVGYGLGLGTRDRDGTVGLCHGGDTVGFRAMLCVFPEKRRAYFIAFNADVEGAGYARLRGLVVDALDVRDDPSPATMPAPDLSAWTGFYVPAPNRMASVEWLDTLFGFVHLSSHPDGLRLRSVQRPPQVLASMGGHLLRAPERTLASHALLLAQDGDRVLASDQQSYVRVSAARLAALWASLVAGGLGLLYILVAGLLRLVRGRRASDDPLRMPWAGIVALALPVPLFLRQSFLQIGDPTPASIVLAFVTGALPIALLYGLARAQASRSTGAMADRVALLASLQWLAVLGAWGLMPIVLWA